LINVIRHARKEETVQGDDNIYS